jgi:PTS system nitrogen regulatory IIA component
LDRLVEEHEVRILDRSDVLEALLEGERSLSTGLEDHIALPHVRTQAVDDLIGVLGIAPDGIPFESRDGKDAQVIALLVVPEDQHREHVQTLAGVASLLSDAAFRDRLVEAGRTGWRERVIEIIEDREGPEFLGGD